MYTLGEIENLFLMNKEEKMYETFTRITRIRHWAV